VLIDGLDALVTGRNAAEMEAMIKEIAGGRDLGVQLVAAGADPGIADDAHGGRPLEWAEHAYQEEAAALLRRHTPDAGAPPA